MPFSGEVGGSRTSAGEHAAVARASVFQRCRGRLTKGSVAAHFNELVDHRLAIAGSVHFGVLGIGFVNRFTLEISQPCLDVPGRYTYDYVVGVARRCYS